MTLLQDLLIVEKGRARSNVGDLALKPPLHVGLDLEDRTGTGSSLGDQLLGTSRNFCIARVSIYVLGFGFWFLVGGMRDLCCSREVAATESLSLLFFLCLFLMLSFTRADWLVRW